MMPASRADKQDDAARWRADLTLALSRTFAALILVPTIAMLVVRVQAGRFVDAAISLMLYGLVVVAAVNTRLPTGWRVAAVLAVLTGITFNIILSRGLGLNIGALAGTFALLTLLAWGRAAAAAAVGAWIAVFAAAAHATAAGRVVTIPEAGAQQVLTTIALWTALTTVGVVALLSVIARLEEGVKSAEELERRLRLEARERLALAQRLLTEEDALRGNLARELHDDIGQRLTAIKITLETARVRRQDTLTAACRDSVRLIQDLERDVVLSSNLRPTLLEEGGFGIAIGSLVREETLRAGITGIVDIPEGLTLRDEAQMPCYRIVQEALTNVIRHARAHSIAVRGRRVPAGIAFVVRDDGVGFDLEAARRLGISGERLGLIGMRERAEGIGADLEIVSSPEAGTEIRLVVPDEGVA